MPRPGRRRYALCNGTAIPCSLEDLQHCISFRNASSRWHFDVPRLLAVSRSGRCLELLSSGFCGIRPARQHNVARRLHSVGRGNTNVPCVCTRPSTLLRDLASPKVRSSGFGLRRKGRRRLTPCVSVTTSATHFRSDCIACRASLEAMSNASRALSDDTCRRGSRRQADPSHYGLVGVPAATGLGLPPTLPFALPFSPPTTLPPLPPLHPSGSPAKLQARRHSAPITSAPVKRYASSPFPPPTTPLPPIPSEVGLDPRWPASLSAISQGLTPAPTGTSRSRTRKAPPEWPPSRASVREEEENEEEEEWRHPFAIASSPTQGYQWDKPHDVLDGENARRGSADLGSGSHGGISPLHLPPLHLLLPPIGTSGASRRSHNIGQDEVSAGMVGGDPAGYHTDGKLAKIGQDLHESCARCRTMKPLSKLRAILGNGPL